MAKAPNYGPENLLSLPKKDPIGVLLAATI